MLHHLLKKSKLKYQILNYLIYFNFQRKSYLNSPPLLGCEAKEWMWWSKLSMLSYTWLLSWNHKRPTVFGYSKLILVPNNFFALAGSFLAGVLNGKKVGSKFTLVFLDSLFCLGSLVLWLAENQNFNLFVGFVVSFWSAVLHSLFIVRLLIMTNIYKEDVS